jgi:hypothetical protein
MFPVVSLGFPRWSSEKERKIQFPARITSTSFSLIISTQHWRLDLQHFESLIATNEKFKNSNVMLCIFHAIWQPFKCDLYHLCPRKSKKGKPIELSKVGSVWGEYFN